MIARAKLRMKGDKGTLSMVIYGKNAESDVKAVEESMEKLGMKKVEPKSSNDKKTGEAEK